MTAATLIIDASALIKLLVEEPDSDLFRAKITSQTQLAAPAHVYAENGEVLSRKLRAGFIDRSQIESAVASVRGRIEIIELTDLLIDAIDLSAKLNASVYDCLYVAAARQREVPLLTADERLVSRLRQSDLAPLLIVLDSSTGP